MERFNYPSLSALAKESADILWLLECESYGKRRDDDEELAERMAEAEAQEQEARLAGGE